VFLHLALAATVILVTGDQDVAALRQVAAIDVLSAAELRLRPEAA